MRLRRVLVGLAVALALGLAEQRRRSQGSSAWKLTATTPSGAQGRLQRYPVRDRSPARRAGLLHRQLGPQPISAAVVAGLVTGFAPPHWETAIRSEWMLWVAGGLFGVLVLKQHPLRKPAAVPVLRRQKEKEWQDGASPSELVDRLVGRSEAPVTSKRRNLSCIRPWSCWSRGSTESRGPGGGNGDSRGGSRACRRDSNASAAGSCSSRLSSRLWCSFWYWRGWSSDRQAALDPGPRAGAQTRPSRRRRGRARIHAKVGFDRGLHRSEAGQYVERVSPSASPSSDAQLGRDRAERQAERARTHVRPQAGPPPHGGGATQRDHHRRERRYPSLLPLGSGHQARGLKPPAGR
jgi:hypothetical protein